MLDPKEVLNYSSQLAYSITSQLVERDIEPIIAANAMAGVFKYICIEMELSYDEFVDLCMTLALDYKEDLKELEQGDHI